MDDDEDKTIVDEWGDDKPTEIFDGIPVAVADDKTPRPERTSDHRLTPGEFASAIDLTDRDAYARGVIHGRKLERAEAIDTVCQLFVIFEIGSPDWDTAKAWIYSRLSDL